jgi:hypothetical protein
MRALGMVLFVIGVLLASCYAARAVHPQGTGPGGEVTSGDRISAWSHVAGAPFAVGMVLLVAGGLLSRVRRPGAPPPRPTPTGTEHEGFEPEGAADLILEGEPVPEHVKSEHPLAPAVLLMRIAAKFDQLPEGNPGEHVDVLRQALDEIIEQDVADFIDQREDLIAGMGLTRFAEMIGHFASMERNTARAWSALTDEAYEEVPPCIERARAGLALARKALSSV